LLDYVEHNGDARVPQPYTVDGYRLGNWDRMQRQKRKGLDVDRERRLEEQPGWAWDPKAARWEEGLSRLVDYVEPHGDAHIPQSCTVDGYRLGTWVDTQRQKRTEGNFDPDRERRLQELPGWTWDTDGAQWEEGFSRLLDYVERNGHARIPKSYTVDGYKLGY